MWMDARSCSSSCAATQKPLYYLKMHVFSVSRDPQTHLLSGIYTYSFEIAPWWQLGPSVGKGRARVQNFCLLRSCCSHLDFEFHRNVCVCVCGVCTCAYVCMCRCMCVCVFHVAYICEMWYGSYSDSDSEQGRTGCREHCGMRLKTAATSLSFYASALDGRSLQATLFVARVSTLLGCHTYFKVLYVHLAFLNWQPCKHQQHEHITA